MTQDTIVIIDLGSEESARLAREIRALGVYSEIHPHDLTAQQWAGLSNVKGIVLNGGPNNMLDGEPVRPSQAILNSGVPMLAVDFPGVEGAQTAELPADDAGRAKLLGDFVFGACGALIGKYFYPD